MKLLLSILFSIPFIVNSAFADSSTIIFEGLNMQIVAKTDEMTDKKSGVIFVDNGPIYLAIYGHDDYTIWSRKDNLLFAHDGQHLIRVRESKPFSLNAMSKRNGLKPTNKVEAESVINSLVKGEEVKLRYFDWPKYDIIDTKIKNPSLAYVYNKAAKIFGWKDFGIPPVLPPIKLSVYIPKEPDSAGYATVKVEGILDLGLTKNFDKYGGGAIIDIGVNQTFGLHKGRWICKSVALGGGKHLIIRDSEGAIVFKEELPKNYKDPITGETWPAGERAAVAAWKSAPLGSIEIEGSYGKRVLLYGFREIWKWGIDNAGFPSLEGKEL